MHSSGSNVESGTTTAAINRLNQPSRVTALVQDVKRAFDK